MNTLEEFCLDTESPLKNYQLAQWYEMQGHTAPAHAYYLRAAERSEDSNLSYSALIKASFCYFKQGSRDGTEKVLLENALALNPKRPEAYYFLSMLYERKSDWQNSYIYSNLGTLCSEERPDLYTIEQYTGQYCLQYQKAIAAWWWGKGDESRALLRDLLENQWDKLNERHQKAVERTLGLIGITKLSQSQILYTHTDHGLLRYKFPGSESILSNHSQIFQDLFVLSMLKGKKNGTFLEIGGAKPLDRNNTALLESQFGWNGVSIEMNSQFVSEYRSQRPTTKVIEEDALLIDYRSILSENFNGQEIDYLQLDIEPAAHTYECLTRIPFDDFRFAVITYEHDYYIDGTKSYREKSREFLKSKGYTLVVGDLSPEGESSFEDWWVHPELVDQETLKTMMDSSEGVKATRDYMLAGSPQRTGIFDVCKNQKTTSWIVDNFYDQPEAVREFALKQNFLEGGIGRGFIGRRTQQQFLFPGLKEKFEEIMGEKITKWEEHGMNGRFQVAWSGEPLVYHCDSQKWGGMLYLTPEAPYQCGTTLYAHKQTRARTYHDEGWDAAWKDIPGDCHLDGTPFEPVDVLGNVFNRLVIFDASCIHSASQYFGTVSENARLWQMFFFDT